MSETIVSLRNIQLSLTGNAGQIDIIKGISLDIKKFDSMAITGPSGSGKSSLLMLIAGLENATNGEIFAFGHKLSNLNEDKLALLRGKHVGIVFQSFHLIPTMTALENVATPLEINGVRDAYSRAEAELEEIGLGERCQHYPAQLSGGEQQRVALARATVTKPDLLLADEPTGNLDQANGNAIIELMFRLRKQNGCTLVLVTHSPDLAGKCDRVVTLADGQLISDTIRVH